MYSEIASSGRLRTHGQQDQAKKIGNICGFFALGWGRPLKSKRKSKDAEQKVLDLQDYYKPGAKKKKIRTTYLNYINPKTKAELDISVTEKLSADADVTALDRAVTTKLRADANET